MGDNNKEEPTAKKQIEKEKDDAIIRIAKRKTTVYEIGYTEDTLLTNILEGMKEEQECHDRLALTKVDKLLKRFKRS